MGEKLHSCPDCGNPQYRIDDTWIACTDVTGCSWSEVVHE